MGEKLGACEQERGSRDAAPETHFFPLKRNGREREGREPKQPQKRQRKEFLAAAERSVCHTLILPPRPGS
jgi:hypothetical protein